jgi:outer membrane protein W
MIRFATPLAILSLTLMTGLVWSESALAQSSTDNSRWYVTLNAGSSAINDVSVNLQRPTQPSTAGKLNLGSGGLYGGSVGYWINPSVRVEGELAYRSNTVKSTSVAGVDSQQTGADLASLAFMVNGLYDFEGWQTSFARFRPFVGAGVGVAQEIDTDLKVGSVSREFSGDRFAYQLVGGVNWYYRSGWFAGARAKWFNAGSVNLVASPANLGTLKTDYRGLSAELTVGYRF